MKGSVFLNNNSTGTKKEVNTSARKKNNKTVKKIGLIMPIADTEGYKKIIGVK